MTPGDLGLEQGEFFVTGFRQDLSENTSGLLIRYENSLCEIYSTGNNQSYKHFLVRFVKFMLD